MEKCNSIKCQFLGEKLLYLDLTPAEFFFLWTLKNVRKLKYRDVTMRGDNMLSF